MGPFLTVAIPAAVHGIASAIGARQADKRAKREADENYQSQLIEWNERQAKKRDVYNFAKAIAQSRGYNFPPGVLAAMDSALARPFPGVRRRPYAPNSFTSGLGAALERYSTTSLPRVR